MSVARVTSRQFEAARLVGTVRALATLSGWLFSVVRRECLRLARRAGLVSAAADSDLDARLLDRPEAELRLDLAAAFESLPPQYREVALMRDIKEMAIDEIGAAIGALGAWQLRSMQSAPFASADAAAAMAHRAMVAHATYSPEVRHPVEVGADQEAHLVAWLSKRLGTELRVPRLASQGWSLVGGRLLPGDGGPAAMFMYENGNGQRLTLYVRRDPRSRDTAFRFAQAQGVSSFYWIDHGLGYALSGEIARPQLQAVADVVYGQLNP